MPAPGRVGQTETQTQPHVDIVNYRRSYQFSYKTKLLPQPPSLWSIPTLQQTTLPPLQPPLPQKIPTQSISPKNHYKHQ